MIKPRRLKTGARIAILSPSSGVPCLFPGIYELGLKNLKEIMAFEIIEMPTARMAPEELYKNPKLRAQDINEAFSNDNIDGIIASIGGYESVRILPFLDTDTILKNPKVIMGFSDSTTFLSYLNYLGMVTFHGPSIMAGFAQLKSLAKECTDHIKTILYNEEIPYSYFSYNAWTNGYKDWNNKETLGECTKFYENKIGWRFLQGNEISEGRLWGGCIEVLEFLKGTDYWPDKKFWDDRILFFETSEDKPLPDEVGYMLRNYGMQGILNKVKGIIFARPKDYSQKEKDELDEIIKNILEVEFNVKDIPVIMDVDFGHTDPKIILPYGCQVRINPVTKEIVLTESPFVK